MYLLGKPHKRVNLIEKKFLLEGSQCNLLILDVNIPLDYILSNKNYQNYNKYNNLQGNLSIYLSLVQEHRFQLDNHNILLNYNLGQILLCYIICNKSIQYDRYMFLVHKLCKDPNLLLNKIL